MASDPALLIAGGAQDPSLAALSDAAIRAGVHVISVLHDAETEPHLCWDMQAGNLSVGGRDVAATAAFIRYDVFTPTKSDPTHLDRSHGWYNAVMGWCLSTPIVRMFNATLDTRVSNKLYVLHRAHAHGLGTPQTMVTNTRRVAEGFLNGVPAIAKPAGGGAYCQPLDHALADVDWRDGAGPVPAIVQPRLDYPEVRIYRIGHRWLAFNIDSPSLDYRIEQRTTIKRLDDVGVGEQTLRNIERMCDEFRLDFCALDLKTCALSGELRLLEINAGPMFAAFDRVAHGDLCAAILDHLLHGAQN